jgi:Flp pilus assembly protein TadD
MNRLPEAIDHAREALRLAPDLLDASAVLCDLLMTAGRSEEALGVYEAAVPRAPLNPELRYGYGTALLLNGRAGEAVAQLREASRLNPRSADVHQNLALALEALGRNAEAVVEQRRAKELQAHARGR